MPNWCQNSVQFTNANADLIDDIEEELKKEGKSEIFKHLRPYVGEWSYEWCCNNWGTKWEASVYNWERLDENTISVDFDTAWGPPINLYEFLYENGWDVLAYYNEEGMAFAGLFEDGSNEEYSYSEMSSTEIEETLPSKLDEMFCISSNRRDWEDEQDPEDEDEEDLKQELEDLGENLQEDKKMGYGIYSNSYQGDYKRVLTVCSANMLRSPTIAHVLASAPYDYNTRSAGTADFALIPVTDELLFWADEIVCADTEHATAISSKLMGLNLDKPVINLRIPDNYEYRNPELIMLIQKRYDSILLSTQ